MAVLYKLRKSEFKNSSHYGKYYAHTVKTGHVGLELIEQMIQDNCSAKRSDVRLVLTELIDVVKTMLQEGKVVELDGLGRFSLSIKSECVDHPEDFDVRKHVKGLKCNFTPAGHRRGMGDHSIARPFFDGCHIEETPKYEKPE